MKFSQYHLTIKSLLRTKYENRSVHTSSSKQNQNVRESIVNTYTSQEQKCVFPQTFHPLLDYLESANLACISYISLVYLVNCT